MQSASKKQRCHFRKCAKKQEKDNADLKCIWENSSKRRSTGPCAVPLTLHSELVLDTHGEICIYMHVWCPAQGHSFTACPLPRCACSPLSGVRHHSVGVSSNLIQEALQGVFGGGGRGGITHKSLCLAYPDLGRPESAWGNRSYPLDGCCLKYKAWPLQLDGGREAMVMGRGRAALLKYDHVFEIDRTQASQLPCC